MIREFLDEKIEYKKLENGLDLFFMKKEGFVKKYAILATNYGSNDLSFVDENNETINLNHGIAHFLEHKMFEQPDETDAFAKFSEFGASANAFTNFNMTAYLFSETGDFYDSFNHLLSYVSTPYFTDENVEEEKGIIAQEIKMYEDNPMWQLFSGALRGMYINHNNSIDIAGTVDSIYKIRKEELYKCYNTFYSPTNMALFVIGDLEIDKVVDIAEQIKFDKPVNIANIKRLKQHEPNTVKDKIVEKKMSVSIPMFMLCYKDRFDGDVYGAELIKRDIETSIILSSIIRKGSELNESLINDKLIYEDLSCRYSYHTDYGYTIISGESRDIDKAVSKIKEELETYKRSGIDKNVFDRVKKSMLGSFVRGFDSIEGTADSFLDYHFVGVHLFDVYEIIKSTTIDDVNRRLTEHFVEDMSVLSIINPIGE